MFALLLQTFFFFFVLFTKLFTDSYGHSWLFGHKTRNYHNVSFFFFFGIDYMFCFAYESIRQQDGERKEEKQLILESAN